MAEELTPGWRTTRETVSVVDVDPELARGLSPEETQAVTERAVARMALLPPGHREGVWGPPGAEGHLGLLIVEGLVIREITVTGGGAAELLGPPDVIRPWDHDAGLTVPLAARVEWTLLSDVRVAVLDANFVRRAASWPTILAGLAARGVWRAHALAVHQAIGHLKRIDQRLLMLFWHLAERWGRVVRGQIVLELPLTHEVLAKLVGARRPSVTTALGTLREQGVVWRREDGAWLLDRSVGESLRAA